MSEITLEAIKLEIVNRLKLNLSAIGEVLEGKIADKIAKTPIYDTGEFHRKLTHQVNMDSNLLVLRLWSNTPHAKFVLGGKVPSWTPKEPLKAWVQRKRLSWLDNKGNKMSLDSMVYLIQRKIKREGIKERNVLAEVIKENENWIREKLQLKGQVYDF